MQGIEEVKNKFFYTKKKFLTLNIVFIHNHKKIPNQYFIFKHHFLPVFKYLKFFL